MKKISSFWKAAAATCLVFTASLFLVNCDDTKTAMQSNDTTLYARLGGTAAITSVIDTFLTEVIKDTVINARFNTLPPAHITALRQNLIDLVAQGTGGNVMYGGKTMAAAHAGMNIREAEFNALVGDLVTSLNKHSVPEKEKGELLAILGPMKTDIVGK